MLHQQERAPARVAVSSHRLVIDSPLSTSNSSNNENNEANDSIIAGSLSPSTPRYTSRLSRGAAAMLALNEGKGPSVNEFIGKSMLMPELHLSAFMTRELYVRSAWHSLYLTGEVAIVAGFGIFYLYLMSLVPYSRGPVRDYYNPYAIAFFYAMTVLLTLVIIAYGFFWMVYGFKVSRPLLWNVVAPAIVSVSLLFFFVGIGVEPSYYGLDLFYYITIGVVFFRAAQVMVNRAAAHGVENAKTLLNAYMIPLGLHIIVIFLYAFVLIPFYRNLSGVYLRLLFRVIVHPLITMVNLALAQFFCMKYPGVRHGTMTVGVVFGVWVESALFGRFLIATIGAEAASILASMAVGVVEILMRALVVKREKLLNFIMFKIFKKTDYDERLEHDFIAQFMNNAMVVENVCILVVPCLIVFFYPHRYVFNFSYIPFQAPMFDELMLSALYQLIIQMTVHYIAVIFELALDIQDDVIWKINRKTYVLWEVLNFIQVVTLIIYVFRTLPIFFSCHGTDPCTCARNQGIANMELLRLETTFCNSTLTNSTSFS